MIKFKLRIITPAQATTWLAKVPSNQRNQRRTLVEGYAATMKAGRWRVTHQAIAFDTEGNLIDGQHRIAAIIIADIPVTMWVATGCDYDYGAPLDMGAKRSLGDILDRSNHEMGIAAATVRYVLGTNRRITPDDVLALERRLPALRLAYEWYLMPGHKETLQRRAPFFAVMAGAHSLNPLRVEDFAMRFASGAGLSEGSPALALRNYCARAGASARRPQIDAYAAAACIRAAVEGETINHVKTASDAGLRWLRSKMTFKVTA